MCAQLNALGIQNVMAVFCQSEPVSGVYRSNSDCRLVVTTGASETGRQRLTTQSGTLKVQCLCRISRWLQTDALTSSITVEDASQSTSRK